MGGIFSTRRSLIFTEEYRDRVLKTDPIGHWVQDEKGGTVSYDMVTQFSGGARNGAYTGPTLGQPGIGDGRTSALYDGALDYDDVLTASVVAAFNGAAGSYLSWIRVSGAGVWTDGTVRDWTRIQVDINNRMFFRRTVVNNQLEVDYAAGGVNRQILSVAHGGRTDFMASLTTWDAGADEFIWYIDGEQEGPVRNGLGVWVGNPVTFVIGAVNLAPNNVWDGTLCHNALWDRALTPAEALSLGVM